MTECNRAMVAQIIQGNIHTHLGYVEEYFLSFGKQELDGVEMKHLVAWLWCETPTLREQVTLRRPYYMACYLAWV